MTLPLAAAMPNSVILLLAGGVGILVGLAVFLVLFLRARPPKPVSRVTVVKGPGKGQGVAVGEKLRIGRDSQNELAISDEELSRFHCEIRREGGATLIVDLKSANGTRVNGKDVFKAFLKPGDEIAIGVSILRCI